MMASCPGVLGDNRLYVKWDFIQNGTFNLRAPGQYFDPETGLLYNNARYFNPRIGAFISGDPIWREGGTNVYAYGVGSLVNDVDESGLAETNKNNKAGGRQPTFDGWTNGNWGGRNWSGGVGGGSIGPAPPLDSGDECYMRHDYCYASGTDTKICDKKLVEELLALGQEVALWPKPPKFEFTEDTVDYRRLAILYFSNKNRYSSPAFGNRKNNK